MVRFWLVRHAVVAPEFRAVLYGATDVALCPDRLRADLPAFEGLAARLPRPARWYASPLSRARLTAAAVFAAGYPARAVAVEAGLTEQDMGDLSGATVAELAGHLLAPAHPFWPLAASEAPAGGESMDRVAVRVGEALERIANAVERDDDGGGAGGDVVAVSHGGAIRAAVAHAMGATAASALHFAVQNLSLTCLERNALGWRVLSVNEAPHGPGRAGAEDRFSNLWHGA